MAQQGRLRLSTHLDRVGDVVDGVIELRGHEGVIVGIGGTTAA